MQACAHHAAAHVEVGPVAALVGLHEAVDALQAAAAGHVLHLAEAQLLLHVRLRHNTRTGGPISRPSITVPLRARAKAPLVMPLLGEHGKPVGQPCDDAQDCANEIMSS